MDAKLGRTRDRPTRAQLAQYRAEYYESVLYKEIRRLAENLHEARSAKVLAAINSREPPQAAADERRANVPVNGDITVRRPACVVGARLVVSAPIRGAVHTALHLLYSIIAFGLPCARSGGRNEPAVSTTRVSEALLLALAH